MTAPKEPVEYDLPESCPNCGEYELFKLRPNATACGCRACHRSFYYPSLIPVLKRDRDEEEKE